MKFNLKKIIIVISIVIVSIALDLITKGILDGKEIPLLDSIVSFSSRHNFGAAWDMFTGQVVILTIISVVFLAVFVVFDHFEKNTSCFYYVAFALIIGGTIGNMIDRIFLGYVRDFIKLEFINFPVFNLADSCLVVGVILFSIYYLFLYGRKKKSE